MVPSRGHGRAQGDGGSVLAQGEQLGPVEVLAAAGVGKGQPQAAGPQGGGKKCGQVFVVIGGIHAVAQEDPSGFPAQDGVVAAEQEFVAGCILDVDVLGQLGGMHPGLSLMDALHYGMIGAGDQADFVIHQKAGLDAAAFFRHDQQGQVDLSREQQLFQGQGVLFHNLDPDSRVFFLESLEHWRQQEGAPEGADAQDHVATFQIADILDLIFGPVKFGKGILGEADHPFSRFGGTDAAGGADEQFVSQLGFRVAEELGQAGLGHEQPFGSPGNAFFFGQGQ